MFNRFTERARKVIILAKEEAKRFNHDYIGTEHILLGLSHHHLLLRAHAGRIACRGSVFDPVVYVGPVF